MPNILKNTFIGNKRIGDIESNTLCLSLKKIKSEFTGNCLRLRRKSDNSESDFGFDINRNINVLLISDWGMADTLYVVKWYDQSGYENDAVQSDKTKQPIWDNLNGKIIFDGINSTGMYITNTNSINVEGADFSLLLQTSLKGYKNYGSSVNAVLCKSSSVYSVASYGLFLGNTNGIFFKTGASAGTHTVSIFDITGIRTNVIGVHREGSGQKLYFDNIQKTVSNVTNPVNNNSLNLLIGYESTIRYTDMDCYSVMLFKKALSLEEIDLVDRDL